MNEGELSGGLGLPGWPAVAEEAIIARDVLLAAHVGSRLHVCHVSTAGSVEIIRWAKAKGVEVTAEVTPHHLLLTDDLRGELRPGLQGQPAAAHAPPTSRRCATGWPTARSTPSPPTTRRTPPEDKDCEWADAAPGMLGLETALSVVQETMVEHRRAGLGRRRRPDVGSRRPGSAGSTGTARPLGGGRAGQPDAGRPGGPRGRSTRPSWPASAATPRTPG